MTAPKIVTHFVHPPIPIRTHDWCAYDDNTYGGDPSDLIGTGSTEQEAIDDLLEQIAERDDDDKDYAHPTS